MKLFENLVQVLLPALLCLVCSTSLLAEHSTPAVSLFGTPKHGQSLEYFDYVNPDAPKGGTLRQGSRVSFDTTNGMRFPGKMPNELDFIYDTLMVRAEDEPAAFYGLLAKAIEFQDGFRRASFQLRPEARWHDGTQLTSDDVAFTFESLRREGLPAYRALLNGIEITTPDQYRITFDGGQSSDWRVFELVATFPIFQKAFWERRDVSKMTLDVPVGSGPYRVQSFDHNRQVTLSRVPDYWGLDLPVNRGRWNFEKVVTDYYSDSAVLIEAMRAGLIDVNREYSASNWLNAYNGRALRSGKIEKSAFPHPLGASYDAIVFNLRRPPLDDRRVRRALSIVFDGSYVRESFYGGLYDRPRGPYAGTPLMPTGPAVSLEKEMLEPYRASLPIGLFDQPMPATLEDASERHRLRTADKLLTEAGLPVRNGQRIHAATGEPIIFQHVGANSSSRSVMLHFAEELKSLGIELEVRYYEYVVGRRLILDHDWDMTTMGGHSVFPPGSNERVFWHSETADEPGYALAGAKDPSLDHTIERMSSGESYTEIVSAAKAFARILNWQHYLLPIAESDKIWIAHSSEVAFPENFAARGFHFISALWMKR